jgi:hypothetical protein
MSVEGWKPLLDIAAVVLLFLTFSAGAGVLFTGNIINKRQEGKLHQFDVDLTGAKSVQRRRKQALHWPANTQQKPIQKQKLSDWKLHRQTRRRPTPRHKLRLPMQLQNKRLQKWQMRRRESPKQTERQRKLM